MVFIMARLFKKTDGQTLDAREINEVYAHIYSNMIAFSLDSLSGSLNQEFVYTDPFATNTGSILTNVAYGGAGIAGSFGHGGTLTGSLTLNPITIGSKFDCIIPYIQGSFANQYQLYFSWDAGITFNEYRSRTLGSAVGVSGSGIVVKVHFSNQTTGSDVFRGFGFYFG